MAKKRRPVPVFETEAEERAFWESHDSSDYVDWSKAKRVRFPNLKPSTKAISLGLPVDLLERIKLAANERDVPSPGDDGARVDRRDHQRTRARPRRRGPRAPSSAAPPLPRRRRAARTRGIRDGCRTRAGAGGQPQRRR